MVYDFEDEAIDAARRSRQPGDQHRPGTRPGSRSSPEAATAWSVSGWRMASEPHLLFGHEAIGVELVVVDPRGRWMASAGDDGTVRVWPMPEGAPFHTLPHAALLDRLRSLTTYRIVEDASASSGYRLDFEPFTGWKREPPRW